MTGDLRTVARGLPLAERNGDQPGQHQPGDAAQRLARWRAQPPFDLDQWWLARLGAAGLTESRLLALLGERAEGIAGRVPPPGWLERFGPALAGSGQDREPAAAGACSELHFGPLVLPLAARGRAELLTRLDAIPGCAGVLDPVRMTGQLAAVLVVALDRMVLRTLVLELERARLAGKLRADDAARRFAEFTGGLAQARRRRALFGQYPVLARQLAVETDEWVLRCARFAGHLVCDGDFIRDAFARGAAVGVIKEVSPGLGDHHRGGTVTRVRWQGGLELVYKPRPVALEVHFQQLLSWAGSKGLTYPLRTVTCLDRGDHGWMEVVSAAACAGHPARQRFYHRQGSLLALLYVLGANDIHAENLIAAGEHPVLVDLETLVQPGLPRDTRARTAADDAAEEAAECSVLNVGLLPRRWPASRAGGPVDVSGLGWTPGQRGPLPVPLIRAARTDMMRVELGTARLPLPAHRPVSGDSPLRLVDYAANVLAGFTQAYLLCQENRADLAAGPLASFYGDQSRVIVRHTAWYAAVLSMAFHPDVLRDGLDREQFLDVLWRQAPQSPVLAACAEHERAELWLNDIPMFTAATASTVLLDSEHRPVSGLTLIPGTERMESRVAGLGPGDLARQRWLIATALGTTAPADDDHDLTAGPHGTPAPAPAVAPLPPGPGPAAADGTIPDELLNAADAIGRRLRHTAFQHAGSAQWLGVNSPSGTTWSVGPLRADLYHGLAGIAFFLGHLGRLTGDEAHTELARQALSTAVQQLEHDLTPRHGGMAGTGGIVYALCELATLWGDESLLEAGERFARRTAQAAGDDTTFDFTGGSAGTIAGLLVLHRIRPTISLADQIRGCADRLLATAIRSSSGIGWLSAEFSQIDGATSPVPGYAHGNAGIIGPLLGAAGLIGDDRYRHAVQQAMAYEQALYDAASGSWDDSCCYPGRPPGTGAVRRASWCRGAAGIGISRLACLPDTACQAASRQEIDSALAEVAQVNPGSHCLCHGAAGTLELYLHAACLLHDPRWQDAAEQHAGRLLASIGQHGWRCGTALGTQTPGLLVGIAGIGYGLLRAADPQSTPAVLTLQTALPARR